jgi:pyruvate dehydrogenase E2 component (dihydrolipoyllysine-residue acetyltransferase)
MTSQTVLMPRLGEDMRTGMIVEWLKKEGEKMEKGDILLRVETEKVTVDVETRVSGVLSKILAPVKSEIPVGEPICIIELEAN